MNRLKLGDPMSHVSVDTETGCWNWQRARLASGYGRFSDRYAHRLYYELFTGSVIPNGMHVDHLCRNKSCCNPEHLEVVTPRENLLRARAARTPSTPRLHVDPEVVRAYLKADDRKLAWLARQIGMGYATLHNKMGNPYRFKQRDADAIAAVFKVAPSALAPAQSERSAA